MNIFVVEPSPWVRDGAEDLWGNRRPLEGGSTTKVISHDGGTIGDIGKKLVCFVARTCQLYWKSPWPLTMWDLSPLFKLGRQTLV